MRYEKINNVAQALIFRKDIPSGSSDYIDVPISDHGYVTRVRTRFAAGENGKLHIRPVVILPGEIMLDLFKYAAAGDKYISGDDETAISDVKIEVENHSVARVWYENTETDPSADPAHLDVDITVEYFAVIEPANIIG